jgi:molybdopterin synthase sulfur carrier subunit
MAFTVHVPGPLRDLSAGKARVALEGSPRTAGEALALLFAAHPGLKDRVVDETGELRPHVNVFVGEESIRHLGGMATGVGESAEIFILPALSGG